MQPTTSLTAEQRASVEALAQAAERTDGTAPLNEDAHLHLGRPGARHWVATDGTDLVGYAQWQDAHGTGQLVVHPDHRRAGHGSALLDAVAAHAERPQLWAFGDLPQARAFAAARGLAPVRGLHVMERPLTDRGPAQAPDGVVLRSFTDADAPAFLAVNAAAFADHPEQGHFSADDLAARQAESWWDPDGLVLAVEEPSGAVLGFHWTKRHDATTGEVYVLGVHPDAAGRGLGGVLLAEGLHRLAAGGATRVILYVDAGNAPAVRLYEKDDFAIVHTDQLYGAPHNA